MCRLCLKEKLFIMFALATASLKKRNEVYNSCRHRASKLLDKTWGDAHCFFPFVTEIGMPFVFVDRIFMPDGFGGNPKWNSLLRKIQIMWLENVYSMLLRYNTIQYTTVQFIEMQHNKIQDNKIQDNKIKYQISKILYSDKNAFILLL